MYVCNYIMYQNIQVEGPIMSTLFMNFLKPSIQPTSKIHTVKTGRVFTVNSSILKVCHKAKYADRGGLCSQSGILAMPGWIWGREGGGEFIDLGHIIIYL